MSNPTEGQGTVYVFVRGGIVQEVRADVPLEAIVIDFDDLECECDEDGITPAQFVRERTGGKTLKQIERETSEVY